MRILGLLLGIGLLGVVVWEMFETIILPRRVERRIRLTRFFFLGTWLPWRAFAGRIQRRKLREELLGFYGPASVLFLFAAWMLGMVLAYSLLFWGFASPLHLLEGLQPGFWSDVYFSGGTFFTLGSGEVLPHAAVARVISVIEAGSGLGFLTVVVAYLPTLYGAFSTREVNISLLDSRAGSPATAGELLRRHSLYGDLSHLDKLLADWEDWSAQLMESHISYPVLCYFRSQHANQSWLAALCCILDSCALIMSGVEGVSPWQARLTFAICRHALVDISQIFHRAPAPVSTDRLGPAEFAQLCEELELANIRIGKTPDASSRMKLLRDMYEPYAFALSELLMMPLPPWTKPAGAKDNWTTSAWKTGHPASSL